MTRISLLVLEDILKEGHPTSKTGHGAAPPLRDCGHRHGAQRHGALRCFISSCRAVAAMESPSGHKPGRLCCNPAIPFRGVCFEKEVFLVTGSCPKILSHRRFPGMHFNAEGPLWIFRNMSLQNDSPVPLHKRLQHRRGTWRRSWGRRTSAEDPMARTGRKHPGLAVLLAGNLARATKVIYIVFRSRCPAIGYEP